MFDASEFLKTLTTRPGVYCMRDAADKTLYVGKAKNLKHRVASYFRSQLDTKTTQFVQKIAKIDITVTQTEREALLLENSLIKSLKPRYNVLFRDDKSYPYLYLSDDAYPQLVYARGKHRSLSGHYYGPYPSAQSVKDTLIILQKLFLIRQCDNVFFKHRSRPCLQYQIQRCSAPCVGYVEVGSYAKQVDNVRLFLEGKAPLIIDSLVKKMEQAAANQQFEEAAHWRDQVTTLRGVEDQQIVHQKSGHADVIAACERNGLYCIQVLYIRHGQMLDSQTFYPKQAGESTGEETRESIVAELLRRFLIQFYLASENPLDPPRQLITNALIEDQNLIAEALASQYSHRVDILQPQQGEKRQWLNMAIENAEQALGRRNAQANVQEKRWEALAKMLGLSGHLNRIECFDVSHMQGEATIASCVVFTEIGALKPDYRRYNISAPAGDDYAAMEQALIKRYLKRKDQDLPLPNIVMVDGGKGQLHRAQKALEECQILDVLLIGIAKGAGRKPGLETLYITRDQSTELLSINLPSTSPVLHLLQFIRDEAHRFAITGHRAKRAKARNRSPLEAIAGVGLKRSQNLLKHFGGQQGLMAASLAAIAQVPGISKALAQAIYTALHGE